MSLPKLETPLFVTKLPSNGAEVMFRPFLVKEEKVLLMALEGGEENEITRAVQAIIKSCLLDDEFDINKMSTFDIEHLFLQIRAKSVGEMVEMVVRHNQDDECKHQTTVAINLEDVKVNGEIQDGKIMINDEIGVKLRYPNLSDLANLLDDDDDSVFNVINNCVEYVFDKDNVYNDFTKEEIVNWMEQLTQEQFKKINDFMENIPRLSHEINWTCSKCGKEDSVTVEGLNGFFI